MVVNKNIFKEKRCVFCKWEELYDERDKYDWNYICPKCKIKCGLK